MVLWFEYHTPEHIEKRCHGMNTMVHRERCLWFSGYPVMIEFGEASLERKIESLSEYFSKESVRRKNFNLS